MDSKMYISQGTIDIGNIVELVTLDNVAHTGTVVAYDYDCHLLFINLRTNESEDSDVGIFNLDCCKYVKIKPDERCDITKRCFLAKELYDQLLRQFHFKDVNWEGDAITIVDTARIERPYLVMNVVSTCGPKGKKRLAHVKRLVRHFHELRSRRIYNQHKLDLADHNLLTHTWTNGNAMTQYRYVPNSTFYLQKVDEDVGDGIARNMADTQTSCTQTAQDCDAKPIEKQLSKKMTSVCDTKVDAPAEQSAKPHAASLAKTSHNQEIYSRGKLSIEKPRNKEVSNCRDKGRPSNTSETLTTIPKVPLKKQVIEKTPGCIKPQDIGNLTLLGPKSRGLLQQPATSSILKKTTESRANLSKTPSIRLAGNYFINATDGLMMNKKLGIKDISRKKTSESQTSLCLSKTSPIRLAGKNIKEATEKLEKLTNKALSTKKTSESQSNISKTASIRLAGNKFLNATDGLMMNKELGIKDKSRKKTSESQSNISKTASIRLAGNKDKNATDGLMMNKKLGIKDMSRKKTSESQTNMSKTTSIRLAGNKDKNATDGLMTKEKLAVKEKSRISIGLHQKQPISATSTVNAKPSNKDLRISAIKDKMLKTYKTMPEIPHIVRFKNEMIEHTPIGKQSSIPKLNGLTSVLDPKFRSVVTKPATSGILKKTSVSQANLTKPKANDMYECVRKRIDNAPPKAYVLRQQHLAEQEETTKPKRSPISTAATASRDSVSKLSANKVHTKAKSAPTIVKVGNRKSPTGGLCTSPNKATRSPITNKLSKASGSTAKPPWVIK